MVAQTIVMPGTGAAHAPGNSQDVATGVGEPFAENWVVRSITPTFLGQAPLSAAAASCADVRVRPQLIETLARASEIRTSHGRICRLTDYEPTNHRGVATGVWGPLCSSGQSRGVTWTGVLGVLYRPCVESGPAVTTNDVIGRKWRDHK